MDSKSPAVGVNDGFGDGEAEARAANLSRFAAADTEESLKELLLVLFANADP
jgi:hypothetical protein